VRGVGLGETLVSGAGVKVCGGERAEDGLWRIGESKKNSGIGLVFAGARVRCGLGKRRREGDGPPV
jgi:hypothetical protein